ncbi:MAG: DNA mismatch repair protein MutS [Treponema sp.]|nr:MAG: DNA mismatch repair protein MutS [Treponema sp.]
MPKKITPMMQQYLGIKAQHRDAVLFFRLGDFYEMFNDDAIEVSRLLNLTLTKRGESPMCGVPFHASKIYIARLLRVGKKIAICEQVSAPIPGELTPRKVVEVITPGTVIESDFLEAGKNNYLASIYCSPKKIQTPFGFDNQCGFAYIDVSTGNFFATSFLKTNFAEEFAKEIGRINPNEILVQQSLFSEIPALKKILDGYPHILQNLYPDWSFTPDTAERRLCQCFGTENLKAFSLLSDSAELPPAGLLLEYIEQTAGNMLSHITSIKVYSERDFLSLDESTRKNLELVTNLRDNTNNYTLFEILNNTKTVMGTRLLQHYIYHPLCDKTEIETRLKKVETLYRSESTLPALRQILSGILDIERLSGRISMERAHGKDLISLKHSLAGVLELIELSQNSRIKFLQITDKEKIKIQEIYNLLDNSIYEDCTTSFTEGNLIKTGWSKELDELKDLRDNVQSVLEKYLETEKAKTGLPWLKIKYNRLNGYFLEISKSRLDKIPQHFNLIKNLINASRFSTDELNTIETRIIQAEEKIIKLEKKIFTEIISLLKKDTRFLYFISSTISQLDVIQCFAQTAILNGWCKPTMTENGILEIIEGRHPVVESHIPSGEFVPNDTLLASGIDPSAPTFALITGPNMAGKSTFLRQNALIVLLAQMGSFVPAKKATISVCDKIFCRVGASDNLARGESTFLVEMIETAYILRNATEKSLVIMDEVGRGTSTEDGLAIAQAVSEYLINNIKSKTLFATHYHELEFMQAPTLVNLRLDVLEADGKIVFLKKVVHGSSGSSYGIHVAGLAGIPKEVLERAKNLIHLISESKKNTTSKKTQKPQVERELFIFKDEELIINEILSINPDELRPIDALQIISRWKKTLNNS